MEKYCGEVKQDNSFERSLIYSNLIIQDFPFSFRTLCGNKHYFQADITAAGFTAECFFEFPVRNSQE